MKFQIDDGGIMPTRAHEDDAGIDLYTPTSIVLRPEENVHVDLLVRVEIPKGYVGLLTSKSGLMKKYGITTTGTIDSGYSGTIGVTMFNHSKGLIVLKRGHKITQLVVLPCICDKVEIVDKIQSGERGENGFGSTGA